MSTRAGFFGIPLRIRIDYSDVRLALAVRLFRWQEDAVHHRLNLRHNDLRMFAQWSRIAKRKGLLAWGCA